jgi:two-component system invasion response regulator UvrY
MSTDLRANQDTIRVVLADDHAMVRQALSQLLEQTEGVQIVGQADDGLEAVRLVTELAPEVLIVDYTMPGLDGPGVIKALRTQGLAVKILVLTVHENIHYAVRVLESGADGYVVKSAAVKELIEAIESVRKGETYISPKVARKVHAQLDRARTQRSGLSALSGREFDVLRAFGCGMKLKAVAEHLNISVSTASTYRTRLMEKLGLESTAEIIRFALEHDVAD